MRRSSSRALALAFLAAHMQGAAADRSKDLDAQLKGKYRFTLNQTCTYSQDGFSTPPPGGDVLGFASTGEDFIDGIVRFNGDGTMSSTERGIFQAHGAQAPGSFPITTYADVCTGRYRVNNDLSFAYEVECTVTFVTGFNSGNTLSVAGMRYAGQIAGKGEGFIASSVGGAVQTMTFSTGFVNRRVCGGSISGVKIP